MNAKYICGSKCGIGTNYKGILVTPYNKGSVYNHMQRLKEDTVAAYSSLLQRKSLNAPSLELDLFF